MFDPHVGKRENQKGRLKAAPSGITLVIARLDRAIQ
jgi:hypothetical protein